MKRQGWWRHVAETASILRRALHLVWAADPPRAAAYALVTLAEGALPVATAWLAKLVLDRLSAALQQRGDEALAGAAFAAAGWYVAARFAGRLLGPLASHLDGNLHARATGYVERRMMETGGGIPDLDHFERKAFQDEIAFLRSEASWRPKVLLGDVHSVASSAITLGGFLALLWRWQPLLPALLIAGAAPWAIAQGRLHRRTFQAITARSEKARMMVYCASVTTEPRAAKELLVFGAGPWFYARWRRLADEALAEMAGLRRATLRTVLLIAAANAAALAIGYAYVASRLGHGLTVGDFALYLSVLAGLQSTLGLFIWSATHAYGSVRYMRRLFAFLDETRPSIAVAPPGTGLPAPERFRTGIELRGVSFTYPEQTEPVLRDVACTLGAGETVALVGENGAGKTTLVKLLTRLYDPCAPPGSSQPPGEILLDGVPLRDYDLAALRRRIAVVFQDFARFSLSAQHNIGVGDVRYVEDRQRVLAAAETAGAGDVLARLPQGLDTPLTRAFEGGVDLSGGEWQKVALARANMRDAALVILDEPTAALDAQAEYDLFQRFRDLAAGRTVLLISHRFSTVRMADRTLVLEQGTIIESGSHAELVAQGGRYAALFEMQAGRYRCAGYRCAGQR